MKIKFFCLAISLSLIFISGCATHSNTLSGDVYTDFSGESSYRFNESSATSQVVSDNYLASYNNGYKSQNNNTISSSNSALLESYNIKTSSNKVTSSQNKNNSLKSKNSSSSNKNTQSNTSTSSAKKMSSSSLEKPLKLSTTKVTNSNKSAFKTVGRCDTGSAKGLALSWGASSIEFSLFCEGKVSLSFSFENSIYPVCLRFEIDGETINNRVEISKSCNVDLPCNFTRGTHTIKITRLTDAESAPVILNEISTYGELIKTAPANKVLYIEAIGAANFCGHGLLLNDSTNQYSEPQINKPTFSDTTLTYPYLASLSLKADCYILSRKGAGFAATNLLKKLNVNKTAQTICNPLGLFPHIYKLINIHSDKENIPTRNPDIIVVDAGVADSQPQLLKHVYSNGKIGISQSQAVNIAADFLNSLKSENPKVKIVWCYGMTSTNSDYLNFIENVIQKTLNDSDFIYTLALPKAKNPTYPTTAEHTAAAKLLYNKIKTILK